MFIGISGVACNCIRFVYSSRELGKTMALRNKDHLFKMKTKTKTREWRKIIKQKKKKRAKRETEEQISSAP